MKMETLSPTTHEKLTKWPHFHESVYSFQPISQDYVIEMYLIILRKQLGE